MTEAPGLLASKLDPENEASCGGAVDPPELIDFLVPRMPRYWLPRFIEFVPELPRTESLKVKEADLRTPGITERTWDRESAGVTLEREVVR